MMTECNTREFDFQALGNRGVTARFDGGAITSDAGGLLLREVEAKTGILRRFAACFTDHRDPDLVEHSVYELLAQRVFGLALGYEDVNDHDALRHDPLLAVLVGKAEHLAKGSNPATRGSWRPRFRRRRWPTYASPPSGAATPRGG